MPLPTPRDRPPYAIAFGATFAALVAVVLGEGVLPTWTRTHGGDVLICVFLYMGLALMIPRARPLTLALAVGLAAVAVEFGQLVRAAPLDAFRATFVGRMTLGGSFDPWDFPHYAAGVLLAWCVDRLLIDRSGGVCDARANV